MVAALTARLHGLDVLLLEKSSWIGGTTATSGGAVWIPDPKAAASLGHDDSREKVLAYLAACIGHDADHTRWEAFLEHGPRMLAFLEARSHLKMSRHPGSPDYNPTLPGGMTGGRRLDPLPFDGRLLGEDFDKLRPPLPAFSVFGGMMIGIPDIHDLLAAHRSPKALWRSARLLARYAKDRLRWGRGTRLLLGNALAARLFRSLLDLQTDYLLSVREIELILEGDAVKGVTFTHAGSRHRVDARCGVVLATGGFASGEALRDAAMPAGRGFHSVAAKEATGDGIELGRSAGGVLPETISNAGFWAPVSVRRHSNGLETAMPHFVWDRQKPGVIAVNRSGRRFVNEARSYHEFVQVMMQDDGEIPNSPAYLVCDSIALRKWGLGLVHPGPEPRYPLLASGYLLKGNSIEQLARKAGVDPHGLGSTIDRYNNFVRDGVDHDFHKGSDAYQRHLGDTTRAQPNLGEIKTAPFYAVRIQPGVIGTALGLMTASDARVLRSDGSVIEGLYACGNDMASIMGGTYPGPGITLGPAMTFGYIAALSASKTMLDFG